MEFTIDGKWLPKCIKCGRVMIMEGYPRGLASAISEQVPAVYAHNSYYCIECYTPSLWVPIRKEGELLIENYPPPRTLVRVREVQFGYLFGFVIGRHFVVLDLEAGITTTNCYITHWREVEEIPFLENQS